MYCLNVKHQYQRALVLLSVLSKHITSQALRHQLSPPNPHRIRALVNDKLRDISQSSKPPQRGCLPEIYRPSAEEWDVADVSVSIDGGQHLIYFLMWKKLFTTA